MAAYKNFYNKKRRPPSQRELACLLDADHNLIRDRLLELVGQGLLEQEKETGYFVPINNETAIKYLEEPEKSSLAI